MSMRRFVYLIKIEPRHDSLERICDAGDVLTQNVLEENGNHNYDRAGFHFDIYFLGYKLASISGSDSQEVMLFSVQLTFYLFRDKVQII